MKQQVTELLRQHAELRVLGAEYERELAKAVPDLTALAKCRWTLARLVSAHLAYESVHLYPALAKSGPQTASLGRSFSSEMAALGGQLGEHVRKWTSDLIVSDWAGFSRSSTDLVRALTARMDREEAELYPAIDAAKAA